MTELEVQVGVQMKAYRRAAGLSLRSACAALPDVPGMDPSALSERERGRRPWTVQQIKACCNLYGADAAGIMSIITSSVDCAPGPSEGEGDNGEDVTVSEHCGQEPPVPHARVEA